jgi:hypothetical protein
MCEAGDSLESHDREDTIEAWYKSDTLLLADLNIRSCSCPDQDAAGLHLQRCLDEI